MKNSFSSFRDPVKVLGKSSQVVLRLSWYKDRDNTCKFYSWKFHSVEKFTTYYSLLMPQKDWASSFRCMVLSHAISVSPLVLPFHVYSYIFFSGKHHLVFCFSPLSEVQLVFSSLKWGCEDGVMVDFVLTCAYTFWPSVRLNLCERKKKKKKSKY